VLAGWFDIIDSSGKQPDSSRGGLHDENIKRLIIQMELTSFTQLMNLCSLGHQKDIIGNDQQVQEFDASNKRRVDAPLIELWFRDVKDHRFCKR
jgi:hypothetical protein